MTWAAWPSDTVRVAEIFNRQLMLQFPEFDEVLRWEDWTITEDDKIAERCPPPEVSAEWKRRAAYPSALEFFSNGLPLAGALSELQWQFYDAVVYSRVDVKAFDVRGDRTLSLTISVLQPSNRPVLGKGIWFDSRPDRIAEGAMPLIAFFDADAAIKIQNALFERTAGSHGPKAIEKPINFHLPIEWAKWALMSKFGSTRRPADISQEAVTASVNEYLQEQSLAPVSKDTVRRAMGERK